MCPGTPELNDDCLFDCLKQCENDISPALRALELPFKENKIKISYFGFKRREEVAGITLISFLTGNGYGSKRNAPQMLPWQNRESLQCYPACCWHHCKQTS